MSSRKATALAGQLRRQLAGLTAGDLLPSERALAGQHGLSIGTVRRALRVLVADGLLRIEGRRGYRVLAHPAVAPRGSLAFVSCARPWPGLAQFRGSLLESLQEAVGRRGWSLLALKSEPALAGEAARHLAEVRASGVIIDTANPAVLGEFQRLGLPVVVVDGWSLDCEHDMVVQDGFAGGILAASWLVQRGHRRVGYLGLDPRDGSLQISERLAGAGVGLVRHGLMLAQADTILVAEGDVEEALRRTRQLLARPDRPTAMLAPWQYLGLAVAQVAKELGLVLGRDLDLVGWSVSQGPGAETLMRLSGLGDAAAVTWDPAELAELSVLRLLQRREQPQLPVSLTRVPVRLWAPRSLELSRGYPG